MATMMAVEGLAARQPPGTANLSTDIYQGFIGKHYEKIFTGLINLEDREAFYTKLMMGKGEVHRHKLTEMIYKPEGYVGYMFQRTYTSGGEVCLIGNYSFDNAESGVLLIRQHVIQGDGRRFLEGVLSITDEKMKKEMRYDVFYFKELNVEVVVSESYIAPDGRGYCLVEIKFCSLSNGFANESNIIDRFRNSLLPFAGFVEKKMVLN